MVRVASGEVLAISEVINAPAEFLAQALSVNVPGTVPIVMVKS